MLIDEYGVARFFEGGDAASAAGNDAAAADAGGAGDAGVGDASGGIDLGGFEDLGEVGFADAAEAALAGIGQEAEVSPGGMTYGELATLDAMGFGQMTGINPNNPTQSVEEALAANNVHGFANVAIPTIMGLAVPGFSTAMTVAQTLGGLASGQVSLGQAIANAAIGHVANQMGISPGMATAVVNGNFGQAAAMQANSALTSTIAEMTGLPPGLIGFGMNVTGAGQALGQGIASNVNSTLGVTPTNNVAAIGQQIDTAFGLTPGQGLGGPASGQSSSPSFDAAGEYSGTASETDASQSPSESGVPSANIGALLAGLGALGMKEEEPDPYQVAQVSTRSPFGNIV